MRHWRGRSQDTVAALIRLGRVASVQANEVLVLREDGQVTNVLGEGRTKVRGWLGAAANWLRLGRDVDGLIAHTDPVKLSYWTEDPSAEASLGEAGFGPPLLTRDSKPIVAQVTIEVSVNPENAERLLRVLGNQRRLTTGDLQERFRDELRAKLAPELEKHSQEELRGNPELLRRLYEQASKELASSFGNFGLRLDNFYVSWGLTQAQIGDIQRELKAHTETLHGPAARPRCTP